MLDRKLILRVLLWALGIAAVTGATAMMLGTNEVVGRVAGTSLAVAIASALMLPLSIMIDHARQRPAGLLGMAGVVVEFVLALALIWFPYYLSSPYWRLEGCLLGTMLTVALATPVAMGFLKASATAVAKWAGRAGLILTGGTCLLALVSIWSYNWLTYPATWWADDLGQTSAALGGIGVLAVAALVGLGTGSLRPWRWLGVLAALVAFVMVEIGIWLDLHRGSENLITVLSVAVVVAHANLTMFAPLKPGQRWLLVVAIGSAMVTAAMVDLYGYFPHDMPFDRLAGAAGIIAGCATLALLVLARINRGVNVESLPHEFPDIALICPRCRKKQKLPLGEAACSACGLKITVRVEEPRCPSCGYLLYMLTSDRCPECGVSIATPPAGSTRRA